MIDALYWYFLIAGLAIIAVHGIGTISNVRERQRLRELRSQLISQPTLEFATTEQIAAELMSRRRCFVLVVSPEKAHEQGDIYSGVCCHDCLQGMVHTLAMTVELSGGHDGELQ